VGRGDCDHRPRVRGCALPPDNGVLVVIERASRAALAIVFSVFLPTLLALATGGGTVGWGGPRNEYIRESDEKAQVRGR
jgi:hypothetical protein